jgi:hypothetical protein
MKAEKTYPITSARVKMRVRMKEVLARIDERNAQRWQRGNGNRFNKSINDDDLMAK